MRKKLANWGNYPVIAAEEKSFSFSSQLSQLLQQTQRFIPRGNGRCYGDASLASNVISTLKFNKILSFDTIAGVFECESGLMLDEILQVIVPRGFFLPVTPGTKFITVGGAVGSDVHGKNHHVDGAFSSHIVQMDIALADGSVITCSPNLNKELFDATCGGMGLTGIILRVKFRLKKIETSFIRQKQVKAKNLEELLNFFETYSGCTYSVAWIDCLKKGASFGRSILILGEHAKYSELSPNRQKDPLQLPATRQITFPFNLPSWVLNSFTISIFNALYYGKNLKPVIDNTVSYEPFFYPLDSFLHWNRGYGKKGFVQYQFVIPLNAREGLVEILTRISNKGLGSFLAVLKVFGDQKSMISFPLEGYTLALDFPVSDGLFSFLDELDEMVIRHGGRLYMSKDARMKPNILESGYPRLNEFKFIVQKYNPSGKLSSLQSERLLLT